MNTHTLCIFHSFIATPIVGGGQPFWLLPKASPRVSLPFLWGLS